LPRVGVSLILLLSTSSMVLRGCFDRVVVLAEVMVAWVVILSAFNRLEGLEIRVEALVLDFFWKIWRNRGRNGKQPQIRTVQVSRQKRPVSSLTPEKEVGLHSRPHCHPCQNP
jgi:hypothetical protein